MTIGEKMHQTLADLEKAKVQLKGFSMDTQDPLAKQQFSDLASQLDGIVESLRGRINYVEQEEPSYKQFS
ncbi:MAG: DUF1657 domain-containing protein [Bacillota bacterium]|jgi:hypothetical protein